VSSKSLVNTARAPTPNYNAVAGQNAQAVLKRVFDTIAGIGHELAADHVIQTISVGYPGPVSPAGIAHSSPTILGPVLDQEVDVVGAMKRRWPCSQIQVVNDLTATGYSYVARGYQDFCLVNLGSGVGSKLFLTGHPCVGPQGRGGEMGHYVVDAAVDALPCECGGMGHLAGIASGRGCLNHCRRHAEHDPRAFRRSAVAAAVQGNPRSMDTTHIVEAFRKGDTWVRSRLRETTVHLARALAGVHAAVGVETFIIVGGFAHALGKGFRDLLVELAIPCNWSIGQCWDHMIELGLGSDEDGLMGAGLCAMQSMWSGE
jgi:glucokinase